MIDLKLSSGFQTPACRAPQGLKQVGHDLGPKGWVVTSPFLESLSVICLIISVLVQFCSRVPVLVLKIKMWKSWGMLLYFKWGPWEPLLFQQRECFRVVCLWWPDISAHPASQVSFPLVVLPWRDPHKFVNLDPSSKVGLWSCLSHSW